MKAYHIRAAGPYYTNTYLLIGENNRAAVIDPAADAGEYLKLLEDNHAVLTHILLTHGHFDHVTSVEALRNATGAQVWLNEQDTDGSALFPFTSPDYGYTDGETIKVDDGLEFKVIATPGHSEGSVCLLCGELLFSGDTLFAGSAGRTDFKGGDYGTLRASLKKLCETVSENVQVFPGHDRSTMLDHEKRTNSFLQF